MKKIIRPVLTLLLCCFALSSCGPIDGAAQKVIDDIESIGDIELSDEKLIEKIETTYSTLTDRQKEQVRNYADLLRAKDKIEEIKNTAKEEENKIRSADSTAAVIKNTIYEFLRERDVLGCGMKNYTAQILDITINDSVWTVSAADPQNFESNDKGKRTWGNVGVSNDDSDVWEDRNEHALAVRLSNKLSLESGSIKVSLYKQEVTCVAYTSGKNTPLVEGVDCPEIVSGNFDKSFEWSETKGITKEGIIVGTAPVYNG